MKLATVGAVNFPPTFSFLITHGLRFVLLALTSSCSSALNDTPSNATAIMSTTTSSASASEASNVFYNTDCTDDSNCLRCNTSGCMKCTKLIMTDSRKCVDDCPNGYSAQWSSTPEFMGRICTLGITNSIQAIFIGVLCGAILCFLIVIFGIFVFKRKQYKIHKKSVKESLIDDEYDKNEFFKQLDDLRPQAEYFLHMLNDTRKQIRKLHVAGDNTAAAKYYPIIRDLAKILILLNRPVELIEGPPHDWNRLLLWAERILVQYKPQITQLIEFLQTPPTPEVEDTRLCSQHTTFKSLFLASPSSTNQKLQSTKDYSKRSSLTGKASEDLKHLSLDGKSVGSLISLQDFEGMVHPTNPFGESFNHVKNYLSTTTPSNATSGGESYTGSTLWLEDEFFRLGERPQDEITTEL